MIRKRKSNKSDKNIHENEQTNMRMNQVKPRKRGVVGTPTQLHKSKDVHESTDVQRDAHIIFLDKINEKRTCNSCHYASRNSEYEREGWNRGMKASSKEEYLLDSGAITHVITTEVNAIVIHYTTGYVLVGNGKKCKSS